MPRFPFVLPCLMIATSAWADFSEIPPEPAAQMAEMMASCYADPACADDGAQSYCWEEVLAKSVAPVEIAMCQQVVLDWWDAKLNENYAARMDVQTSLDAENGGTEYQDRLREMQRAWIPYRDAYCQYYAKSQPGGSGAITDELECLINETKSQTRTIENPMY